MPSRAWVIHRAPQIQPRSASNRRTPRSAVAVPTPLPRVSSPGWTTARTAIASAAILIAAVLVGVALPVLGVPEWATSGVAVLVGVAAGVPIGCLILQRLDYSRTRR